MIVPKVRYGIPVPQQPFTSVPDPSAHAPRLGCQRLRGRPRRPGRRAGGRDEMPVSAGLRAAGAVVPGLPAAAPTPVRLPHRRSRRRHPIRPPLAPVLPRPQFCKAPGETLHGPGSGPKFASRPSRSPIRYGSTISRCVKRLLGAISLSFFIWRTAARPPALESLAGSMPYIVTERIWRRNRWPPEAQAGASRPHPRRLTLRSHPESPNWCRSRPARPGRACLHFAQCPPGRQQ